MRARMRIGRARRRAAKELRGLDARLRGRSSLGDRDDYRDACREAVVDDEAFAVFKRDPRYVPVLEHVAPDHGAAYLQLALERAPELEMLLERFRGNDRIGSPARSDFGRHGEFSPTTLRYMKVLADLQHLFGTLAGFDIVEIGGGYGGQAFVCAQSAELSSYTLVDLPEAAALQSKYLDRLGVRGIRAVAPDAVEAREYDLAISNYAFSELTRSAQRPYLDGILLRAARGYLTLNRQSPRAYRSFTVRELLARIPGSSVLPMERETALDRKAHVDILVWGTR